MINLYTDIYYKNLYQGLLELLKQRGNSIFAESWIVVPNHSAKQWLQKSLAKDLGICAQIKFILPLKFNWEIIKNVAEQEHEINIFTSDVLRWQVLEILNNNKKYEFLKQNSDIKNFNLAEKIAQTLLKYNEDHPAIIAKWDNEIYADAGQNQWQVEIWQQLQDKLPTKSPVELLELFEAAKDFKGQPENIIIFACEQLTNLQKATILKLSQSQDIQIFLSNPSPNDYWFDIKPAASKAREELFNADVADIIDVSNPLLANLGYNKMAIFDAFLQEDINLHIGENNHTGTNLLQSLRQDIFNLVEKPIICAVDDSIRIHSCHNRKREIEVIKDDILANLDANKSLKPEDIIVVAPNINDYVEYIKDAFNATDSQYLPFHIDRIQLADNQYIQALMQLLESFTLEMSATVIYELFSQAIIQQKFNINANDLPRIKNWILNSNIRNFYSKQHKSDLGYEAKIGNTWQFGKNRWLAGYLADDVADSDYLTTYGNIAGQEEIFSQCFDFLDLWFANYQESQSHKTPQQWFDFVQKICQQFLYNDLSNDYQSLILKQLETKFITQVLDSHEKIPLVIVNNIIEAVITENNYRSEGQIGIRFQTWENAFIANANLLIILGLNDNEFPQKQIKNDLDIFNKNPARLNKSTRQRDKNLLLSALTENNNKLIMTYVGFDTKTNEGQPPSVILSELISYLEQKTNNKFSINEHKMHGYHQQYFSGKQTSYNQQQYQLAKSYHHKKSPSKLEKIDLNQEPQSAVKVSRLIVFFSDPLDYFLKNNAELNQKVQQDILQDTESYFPSGLEVWQLKHEIFKNGKTSAIKTGIVSDNKVGHVVLSKYTHELDFLHEFTQSLKLQIHIIDCVVDNFKISGNIDIDDKQCLISIFPTKVSAKNICQHWIKHLCYQANQASYAYFEDKILKFTPLANYTKPLLLILQKWQQSFSRPWLFVPPKMLNSTSKISIKTRQQYLQQFIKTEQIFPSEGQKYFKELVAEYREQEDAENYLSLLMDNIEYLEY